MSVEFDRIQIRAKKIVESSKTLFLSTVDRFGTPNASIAPFVKNGVDYHVFTSSLSKHTTNLLSTKQASILFVEEPVSKNPFARKRFTALCGAQVIPRENPQFEELMSRFEERFGKDIFDEVRPLGDFTLFALKPVSCNFVYAFGKAYVMNDSFEILEHRTGSHEKK